MSELSSTDNTFRRWRHLDALETKASRPGYDLVELVRGNNSGYSWTWSEYDLDRLRREQVEWVIIQEHPHLKYSQTDLSLAAELLPYEAEKFDPFTGTEIPAYDRIDAFYQPVADFGGLSRPGPKISIYRIETP